MKIIEKLKTVPADKWFHYIAGWAIVATLAPFSATWAVIVLLLVAGAKEIRDANGHGTLDLMDFLATILGGVGAMAIQFVLGIIF